MPVHIHPTAALAPRALLPGDPGRALMLAQLLLDQPRMFNHNRGLWGYTGAAADGEPLTIQSTGMGGPSAAIVMEELCDLGLRAAIRVGTCGALDAGLRLGDVVVADAALATDGASRALGAGERVAADRGLAAALRSAAGDAARVGLIASSDLFYERDRARVPGWAHTPPHPHQKDPPTLLRVAELRGVRAGCVLAVSDVFEDGARRRIDADALASTAERIGLVAAAALGASAA
jgi:uridine phosphorylase